jgi:hypothetical protein
MRGVQYWWVVVVGLAACGRWDFDENATYDAHAATCRVELQPQVAATYYGIGADEVLSSIHSLQDGDVLAATAVQAGGYPSVGGVQPVYGGGGDLLAVRFSGDLSTVRQATYYGSSAREIGQRVTYGADDALILTAWSSGGWPVTTGAAAGMYDGFPDDWAVARLSSDLTTNLGATYWSAGEQADEQLSSACTDPNTGDIYLVGEHLLGASPTLSAPGFDLVKNGGTDAAAVRFDAALTTVKNNTLYGLGDPAMAGVIGAAGEEAFGSCVVRGDDIFVTGHAAGTFIGTMATPGAYVENPVDVNDPFICRFSTDLVERRGCTHLGIAGGVALTRDWQPNAFFIHPTNGDLYVVQSVPATVTWISATAGALQAQPAGNFEIAITRFRPDLSAVVASTFYGTPGDDLARTAVVLPDGSIAIAGMTSSQIATTPDALQPIPPGGAGDGILFVVDADLTAVKSATYFGDPSALDVIYSIDFEPDTRSLVMAGAAGPAFGFASAGAQSTFGGGMTDGFVARVGICAP